MSRCRSARCGSAMRPIADRDDARALIDQHLDSVPWLADLRGRTFYPVGGAWRTLARIHMEQIGYPLHVIQHYRIDRDRRRICRASCRGSARGRWPPSPACRAGASTRCPSPPCCSSGCCAWRGRTRRLLRLRPARGPPLQPALRRPSSARIPLIAAPAISPRPRSASAPWAMAAGLDPAAVPRRDPAQRRLRLPSACSATSPGATTPTTAPSSPSTASCACRSPASTTRARLRRGGRGRALCRDAGADHRRSRPPPDRRAAPRPGSRPGLGCGSPTRCRRHPEAAAGPACAWRAIA